MSIVVMVVWLVLLQGRAVRSRRRVQLAQRGGVLLPGRIVVDGEDAAVRARLADRARHHAWRPRCARGRPGSGGPDDRRRRRWCSARRCVALPATPTQPAIAVCAPMRTLWPIWIRLSSLTPSSITVSSSAPRSMQVLAPISTSSPMRTAPSCSIFSQRPRGAARSRSRRRRSPRRCARCRARRCGSRRRASRAARAACRRRCARRADEALRADHAPSPITAPASITASGRRGVDRRALGSTTRSGGRRRGAARVARAHHCVRRAK